MGQITLQGVHKSFGQLDILQDANLDIEDGSFVVFVGPSGCGKTTLLRLIAGLEDVTDGRILIDGKNVVNVPPAKRGLSMVFQSYALYPHMSVRGNIAFGLKMAGLPRAEIDSKVAAAAATLNLTPYLDRKPRELSGGQRQRVAIARALLADPRILILDDATSSVDARTERAIKRGLREVMEGRTTFIIAHRLSTISLADEIVVIDGGRIVDRGTHDELMKRCSFYAEIAEFGLADSVFLQRDLEEREEVAKL
jgi:multiple sugar transport system ATP-binding protein